MKPHLDNWEKVLLALYGSVLCMHGFSPVDRISMRMKDNEFNWTLYILQMRGAINGCEFEPPTPDSPSVLRVKRDRLMLTPKGFEIAESLLDGGTDENRLLDVRKMMQDIQCVDIAKIIENSIP